MIKTKKVIEEKEVEYIEDIICNKCGNLCPQLFPGQIECATLYASWGYGSRRDGSLEEAHICPDCYEDLIDSFIIKDVYRD